MEETELPPAAAEQLAAIQQRIRLLDDCGVSCLDELEQLIAEYGRQQEVVDTLRTALVRSSNWQRLIDFQMKVAQSHRSWQQRFDIARASQELGLYTAAADRFAALLTERPDDHQVLWRAAEVDFELGAFDRALERLDRIPNDAPHRTARIATLRGLIALHRNQLDLAEQQFLHALDLLPDRVSPLGGLARVYSAAGRQEEATAHRRRLAELQQLATGRERRRLQRHSAVRWMEQACPTDVDACDLAFEQLVALTPDADRSELENYRNQLLARESQD